METILGIDLGTTNSEVSVIKDGVPIIIRDAEGQTMLPSVVGLDNQGQLLVGQPARNQAILAPERTIKSIKRKMGQDTTIQLGDQSLTPQEVSAVILRTLRKRAEAALGQPLTKAVITVPAFFKEMQRQATLEAGELAGLDVVRIINEPTAASLVYQPTRDKNERILVYDLGGGTFDVSVVQIEQGIVEVLASHGDTRLGGDDFDQLLLDYVSDQFLEEHGVDLRTIPAAKSRLLQAVEEAKKRLSAEAYTSIEEEFIAEKDGHPLNLSMVIDRLDYEAMIGPLLEKTIQNVDAALEDAKLRASEIDEIILVGGASRTPLVQRLLEEQLGREPLLEIDPDLCVAMGAAVQAGMIAGADVERVLVDITPHTLGIECLGTLHGMPSPYLFSPVIARNTPLPARRSEIYYTHMDGQKTARIRVLQGEDEDARMNKFVGEFKLDGLDEKADQGNEILVRFEMNLDGMLTVTAQERATSLAEKLTIDNAITQFQAISREDAKRRLAVIFDEDQPRPSDGQASDQAAAPPTEPATEGIDELIAKSERLAEDAAEQDADDIRDMINELRQAISSRQVDAIRDLRDKLEDVVFYLEDV